MIALRRTVRALLALTVGLVAASLVIGQPASAMTSSRGACAGATGYPFRPSAALLVDTTTPAAGSTVEVAGTGFCPDEAIAITVDGATVATARTDSNGSFDPPLTVRGPAGKRMLCGSGASALARNRDCLTLTVRAAQTSPPPTTGSTNGTALTGTRIALLVASALILIAGGVAVAAAGRARAT